MSKEWGPGSIVKNIYVGPFKFEIGCDDNKKRPETVYIKQTCWVGPKLDVKNVARLDNKDKEKAYAISMGEKLERELYHLGFSRFVKTLDPKFFEIPDKDDFIVSKIFDSSQMDIGKRVFLSIEYYCLTVNTIDYNTGKPTKSRSTRKVEIIPFDLIAKHIRNKTIPGIMNDKAFKNQKWVYFNRSQKGK